jgi:hypothetical protein
MQATMLPEEPTTKLPPVAVRRRCLRILLRVCTRYWVAPAEVVAHVRDPKIDRARRDVMAAMLDAGLTREQVATAFGRDLRRTRYSSIGGLPSGTNRAKADFTRFDLLGNPLAPTDSLPRAKAYRHRFEDALRVVKMLGPVNRSAAEWLALQED